MEIKKQKILLFLKLDPRAVKSKLSIFRDVTNIGNNGTGDVELSISTKEDFDLSKPLIEMTYENIGG